MYNPFEDPARRRQPQLDPQMMPPMRQPAPMYSQPAPPGPQMPMQMVPMGDDSGQMQQNAGAAGGGLADLLKRFSKPKGGLPGEATGAGPVWG